MLQEYLKPDIEYLDKFLHGITVSLAIFMCLIHKRVILSEKFFVVIDILSAQLKDMHIGCHIKHIFADTLAYTDDLIFIIGTVIQMQSVFTVSSEFFIVLI